ncbi:MAG: hypothetical protein R8K47_04540 [Mariprofundaceae bacterium]
MSDKDESWRQWFLDTVEESRRKVANRGMLSLGYHAFAFTAVTLVLGGVPVITGMGHVWAHTQPEPTAFQVNGAIGWALVLLWHAYTLRVQVTTSRQGLPEESAIRRRFRLAVLWFWQLQVTALVIEALILIVRNAVWWFSWH